MYPNRDYSFHINRILMDGRKKPIARFGRASDCSEWKSWFKHDNGKFSSVTSTVSLQSANISIDLEVKLLHCAFQCEIHYANHGKASVTGISK